MLRRVCGLPAAVWTVVAFAVAVAGLSLLPLPEQVKANATAALWKLSPEELREIDTLVA